MFPARCCDLDAAPTPSTKFRMCRWSDMTQRAEFLYLRWFFPQLQLSSCSRTCLFWQRPNKHHFPGRGDDGTAKQQHVDKLSDRYVRSGRREDFFEEWTKTDHLQANDKEVADNPAEEPDDIKKPRKDPAKDPAKDHPEIKAKGKGKGGKPKAKSKAGTDKILSEKELWSAALRTRGRMATAPATARALVAVVQAGTGLQDFSF